MIKSYNYFLLDFYNIHLHILLLNIFHVSDSLQIENVSEKLSMTTGSCLRRNVSEELTTTTTTTRSNHVSLQTENVSEEFMMTTGSRPRRNVNKVSYKPVSLRKYV